VITREVATPSFRAVRLFGILQVQEPGCRRPGTLRSPEGRKRDFDPSRGGISPHCRPLFRPAVPAHCHIAMLQLPLVILLESHRREIVVVFCDLRGYTAFTETAEPEEVLKFLREYHGALGPLVAQFEGTLDQFSGDGIMVFFNDPVPCPDPAARAVNMAVAMRGGRQADYCLASPWLRTRFRSWYRAGLRDPWPDRLFRTLRLHRDRYGMQPRRAALC
jgi:Adenylate and Guanylate cyclase catalytic domain